MRIDWQVPIEMDDGIVLRADVYRPIERGEYPVILTYGVYGKGVAYQEGYASQWNRMVEDYPEILEGSTNKYQNWETTDPERWIPDGYVCVRVDSRGAGWSPGVLLPDTSREVDDLVACIEWAGTRPWSYGKVGMLGISYYARNQWRAAGRKPEHLAGIIPWEGGNDCYRDSNYHGGILSEFRKQWATVQVVNVQYGRGELARTNPNTGQSVAGPVTLSDEELAANRRNVFDELKQHPLWDEWHADRSSNLSLVECPVLSCANWGGQGIHPRGNFNGFIESPSEHKWLEVHGDSHWSLFSSGYGHALQKGFFDHYLKGIDNGWEQGPRVRLNIRHPGDSNPTLPRDAIFERLYGFGVDTFPVPYLAEGHEISDDGLTWTITLRQGIKFHNGEEMTADDVIASWGRYQAVGARMNEFFMVDEITKSGDYSIDITTNEEHGGVVESLAAASGAFVIMPKSVIDSLPMPFEGDLAFDADVLVGTGPYQYVEHTPERLWVFDRFEDYWGGPPGLTPDDGYMVSARSKRCSQPASGSRRL